ncbi:MAG: efflux RND transporter periplasmic adaptor subunit [Anaerolineae bacterium]|jgi:HlyD family secretion protein|nr:efflux RND transporter periplasmic adaptor subunit [Anaerolineae bacterium]
MNKWVKTLLVVLLVLGVGVGLFFGLPLLQERNQAQAAATAQARMLENTVFARIDDLTASVSATGSVRAAQSGIIVWQTSGVVESVNVDLGDLVVKGDKLAELDSTTLGQSIISAESQLANAQKALDDLLSSNTPAAQAKLNLILAQEAYDDEVDDRGSLAFQRVSNLTLDQLKADWLLAQNEVDNMEDLYENYKDRAEEDPVRLSVFSQLTNARKAEERARANYYYALGDPDEQEIGQADAELELAEARLADAQREWDRLKDGPAAEDILAAEAQIEIAEATLKTAYVEATFNGTITDVMVMEGDSVNIGTMAFRVDDLEHLYIDATVLEIDINAITVGQTVEVTFDAAPGNLYTGIVNEVGKVGQSTGAQVQFPVTIEVIDADENVKPGMTADVTIITNELKNALLVPNQALFFDEDRVFVEVLTVLGGIKEVDITTGLSANSLSEVLSGDLKEGDELVLNLPDVNDNIFDTFEGGPPRGFFGD